MLKTTITVKNRITGEVKKIKLRRQLIDQWDKLGWQRNPNQVAQFLKRKGKLEDGMIVIEY